MLNILKLPDANVVAANTRSVFSLPIGYTYHQLILTMGGTTFTKAHLDNMRLKINGTVEMELGSGTHRETMNLFNKKSAITDDQLIIDFERPGTHYPESRNLTVIGTGFTPPNSADAGKAKMNEVITLQLEVDIAGATAPTLELHAVVSAPQPLGVVQRITNNTYSLSAGKNQIVDLPRASSKYGILDKVVIKHANVTALEISRDRETMQELTPERASLVQNDGVRAAQAGYLIWDSTQEGFGAQGLDVGSAQDLRLELEASGADTVEIYSHYLGSLR